MSKQRWHAGLTREQAARARQIQAEHIHAWYDEQARGAFGKPGSIWEIVDGKARLRGPNARELVVLNSIPSERVH
jgi:hypothetical protein